MEIGASTACLYPMLTEDAVNTLIGSGFKVIEIFFNSFSELEPDYIKNIREKLDMNNCRVASVHPFLSSMEPFLFFSNYKRRFYDSLALYEKFFLAATILGAKKLIIHGGAFPDKYMISDEEYCRRFSAIAEKGNEYGVKVLHENVNKFRASTPEFILEMKRIIPDKAAFTLDIKQAVRSGQNPFIILEAMGNSLAHIHINDNTEDNDCLLPSAGTFDYTAFLKHCKALGYDNEIIIEVYRKSFNDISELRKSYEFLREILNRI